MARNIARQCFRRLKDSSGTNILEAAIITPLLLLLTFGVIDFGALLYVDLTLQNGVSQASRYGVTGNVMPDMSREESIRAAMRSATPTLTLEDDDFTFHHMSGVGGGGWLAGIGGPSEIDKVTVDYTWQIMTPVIRPFFTDGVIHFRVESAMKNESSIE
jgi:hypothetical protein